MRRLSVYSLVILFIIITLCLLNFSDQVRAASVSPQIQPPGTERMEKDKIGVILDLPEGSSQLEIGKEVYRLVCSACHAYDGSGLIDAWRATWNPKDQNCWQSKCHGANHPDDGFYLPKSPAIVGSFFPYLFPNALALNQYISEKMPWHDPGVLPADQAWAVTAYTMVLNGYDPGENLNADNAASIQMQPKEEAQVEPSPTIEMTSATTPTVQASAAVFVPLVGESNDQVTHPKSPSTILIVAVAAGIGTAIFLILRKRK